MILESRNLFWKTYHLYLSQGFGSVFILKGKCGNEWYLVAKRPTCHSSKEGWLHKGVCVDLAEMITCPVGTEKKAGILPQLHSQWEIEIGNWAYHGTCFDSEWYM